MMRRVLLVVLLAVAGVALSCGACPPTTAPAPSYQLATTYALSGPLPLVVRTDSGRVLRSYGDTLRFSAAASTYTESGTLGTAPTGQSETTRAYTLPPTSFSRTPPNALVLPNVLGGSRPASATLLPLDTTRYSALNVLIDDAGNVRSLYYHPVP